MIFNSFIPLSFSFRARLICFLALCSFHQRERKRKRERNLIKINARQAKQRQGMENFFSFQRISRKKIKWNIKKWNKWEFSREEKWKRHKTFFSLSFLSFFSVVIIYSLRNNKKMNDLMIWMWKLCKNSKQTRGNKLQSKRSLFYRIIL